MRGNGTVKVNRAKPQTKPFMEPVGFGELIALRTEWTDDPSGITADSGHGRWAGDRPDVVMSDETEQWKTGEV